MRFRPKVVIPISLAVGSFVSLAFIALAIFSNSSLPLLPKLVYPGEWLTKQLFVWSLHNPFLLLSAVVFNAILYGSLVFPLVWYLSARRWHREMGKSGEPSGK
jgi:hypothetical protein